MWGRRRNRRRRPQRPPWWQRVDWGLVGSALRPLGVLAVVALLATAGWRGYHWLMRPDTLPVRHVQITGTLHHVDRQALQARLREAVRGGFFSLDLDRVRAAVEALPWVYRVSLQRVWPDRLVVAVEEQQPIARWGGDAFLNRYGEVFHAPAAPDLAQLPRIDGQPGREKALIARFVAADRVLSPLGLAIAELSEDARHAQRLRLVGGLEVILGRERQMARLERFAATYERALAPFVARVAAVDLRYANGFTVRWRQGDDALASAK